MTVGGGEEAIPGGKDRGTRAAGQPGAGKVSCIAVSHIFLYLLSPVLLMTVLEVYREGMVYCLIRAE